jgi:hypothetical protein
MKKQWAVGSGQWAVANGSGADYRVSQEQTSENDKPETAHCPLPTAYLLLIASLLSIIAFAYFYSKGMTNLYGDGVARLNIARKVVDHPEDSLWQRYIQIGTPWLPLQTVLMLPMVSNDWMWRTGLAGSIISMLFYVLAALMLYLHAKHLYRNEGGPLKTVMPMLSAAIFLLNPSALYLQTTPMTELVFMGALAAAVYLLQRWAARQTWKHLAVAAAAMSAATLARYEAWPVAGAAGILVMLLAEGGVKEKLKNGALFSALVGVGPAYWLWHNWAIYGDALEFLTGPYSARGIYLQNQANLGWTRVLVGHALLDLLLMGVTVAVCVGPLVMMMAAGGLAKIVATRRRAIIEYGPALLLTVPFFFHVLSLYRGEIQIFPLSAFGLLNVRYGLPHLLGVALFAPAALLLLKRFGHARAIAAVCAVIALQYGLLVSDGFSQIAVYQEGFRNGVNARSARERARAAAVLIENPPPPLILMHTGALGPLVIKGGLRFSNIIHEGTARWHQIEGGLPADVSTIIFQQGDPLDLRITESPKLAGDLASDFELQHSAGKIKLYRRK